MRSERGKAHFTGSLDDPRENPTAHVVDPLGRVRKTTFADGYFETTVRDAAGHVDRFTDARGFTTDFDRDRRGNVVRIASPDGSTETFTHNGFSQITSHGDSYEHTTRFTYDSHGNLLRVVDPEGNPTQYTYFTGAQVGLVEAVTDARGFTTHFEYDSHRRLQYSTDPYSQLTTFNYDSVGNPWSVIDPLQRVAWTVYDALNRLRETTDVFGGVEQWDYDATGLVALHTDPRGATTQFTYDSRGLTTRYTEALGTALARTTKTEYDAAGNAVVEWRPRTYDGQTVANAAGEPFFDKIVAEFDVRNRPERITEGSAYLAEETEYDTDYDGALARTRRMGYDPNGNLAWEASSPLYDAAEATPEYFVVRSDYTHDAMNRTASVTEGRAGTVTGSVFVETQPGRTTVHQYDLNGNLELIVATDNTRTRFRYDALDRLVRTTEAAGTADARLTQTQYDPAGNVSWTLNGTGTKTLYAYDKLNRLVETTEAVGTAVQRSTLFAYDKVGRVVEVWEPRSYDAPSGTPVRVGTFTAYDDALRTETTTRAAQFSTSGTGITPFDHKSPRTIVQRDAAGDVVRVTDPLDRVTKTDYDQLGRPVVDSANWSFNGTSETFDSLTEWSYDAADNVRSETRSGVTSQSAWQSVTDRFTFDVHERQTLVRLATASSGFPVATPTAESSTQYDAWDQPVLAVDPAQHATQFAYTRFGEMETLHEGGLWDAKSKTASAYLRTTAFAYDDAGRVKTETRDLLSPDQSEATYGGPRTVTTAYRYDRLGRTTAVVEAVGLSAFQRTTRYAYDGNDRLITVAVPLKTDAEMPPAPTSDFVRVDENQYDALGRLVRVTEGLNDSRFARTSTMGYDAADNSAYAGVSEATNDAQENRAPQSVRWVWDATQQKEVRLVVNNEYDGEGNLVYQLESTQTPGPYLRVWAYEYDHRNRLKSTSSGRINLGQNSDTIEWLERVTYGTDAEDRVYQRQSAWTSAAVRQDEYGQLISAGTAGTDAQRYVRDGTTVYADLDGTSTPTRWYVRGGPNNELLGRVDLDGNRYFYATDKQGTVLSAYRDNGSTLAAVKVVAYDRTSVQKRWPSVGETITFHDRFEYAGLEYDPTTKMVSDTSRWFDPQSGRYTGQTGPGLGSNPYSVAGNSAPNVEPEPKPSAPSPKDDRNWFEQGWDWGGRTIDSLSKPSANASSNDFLDRQVFGRLGNLYNDDKTFQKTFDAASVYLHYAGGVSNALSFGLTSLVAEAGGYDESKRTAAESMAWTVGEVVGTVASLFIGIGAAKLARVGQTVKTVKSAKALLQHQAIGSAKMLLEGVDDATTGGKGLTWENGLMIGGGLVGGRMDLGGLAKLGAAGKVGRGLLAAEKAVGKVAFQAVNKPLSLAVHGGLSRVSAKAHDAVSLRLNKLGFEVCFAAGTPIRTPDGWKLIEQIVRGEHVLSRSEFDPDGDVLAKPVDEVFVREGLIWHMQVKGRLIRTTAEHPFEVEGKGWTPLNRIAVGERLWTEARGWVTVEAVEDTGVWGTVYNLRVADFHTYFVGKDEWGFSVWVHNANYGGNVQQNAKAGKLREARVVKELQASNPGATVQRERYLRDSAGKRLTDPLTGEARRIDIAVIKNKKVVDLVEVTSQKAPKADQIAKEQRIRELSDTYIRDKNTRELLLVNNIATRLVRRA